jgi:hypothetical protein
MHLEAYVNATLPPKYTIWGLELKDLCLGHYLLMRKYGSNYANDEITNVDIIDLLIGLIICSKTYEQGIDFFNQEPIPFFSFRNFKSFLSYVSFVKMGKCKYIPKINGTAYGVSKRNGGAFYEISKYGRFVVTLSNNNKINLPQSFSLFSKYLEDGRKMPFYWTTRDDEKASGSHWSLSLFNVLVGKLGYSSSDALNIPLSKAFYEYAKYAESEGAIELFENEEEEMVKE